MSNRVTTTVGVVDRASSQFARIGRNFGTFRRGFERNAHRVAFAAVRMARAVEARLARAFGTLWRRVRMVGLILTGVAVVMGRNAVRAAMRYEQALRNVTSLIAGAGASSEVANRQFREFNAAIQAVASSRGASSEELARGLYDIVSATFQGEDAMRVLDSSAEAAFAGLSSVSTVTDLLTSTLLSFKGEQESMTQVAAKSTAVMDAMFMSVNVGKFTFDDLAQSFGGVASTGAAVGVTLEDMLAFMATATIRGVSMEETVTGLRQTLLSFAKVTPDVARAAEELLGPDWEDTYSARAIASKGLLGVMTDLSAAMEGKFNPAELELIRTSEDFADIQDLVADRIGLTVESLAALFPNIRALKTVLAVTGPGLEIFANNFEQISNATGAQARATEEMKKSTSGMMRFVGAAWEQAQIMFGSIFIPFLHGAATAFLDWWGDIPQRMAQERGFEIVSGRVLTSVGQAFEDAPTLEDWWANIVGPGEKLAFVVSTAWKDGIRNVREWFDSGGGRGVFESIGSGIGGAIRSVFEGLAGTSGSDVSDNLFVQMGKAIFDGFREAWEGFDKKGFVESGFGQILMTALGYKLGGVPGAFVGLMGARSGGFGMLEGGGGPDVASVVTAVAGFLGIQRATNWLARGGMSAAGTRAAAATAGTAGTAAAGGARAVPGVGTVLTAFLLSNAVLRAFPGVGDRMDRPSGFGWFGDGPSGQKDLFDKGRGADDGDRRVGETFEMAASTQRDAALAFDASVARFGTAALGIATAASTMSAAAGRGAFAGIGGGITRFKKQALGGSGTVTKPTLFLAGEAGAEDYAFMPRRVGGAGASGGVVVNGPLIGHADISSDMDLVAVQAALTKSLEDVLSNG